MTITNLKSMLDSDEWQAWDSDNRSQGGSGIILGDPERYDRIAEASKEGSDGSTHGEIIEDWREFMSTADDSLFYSEREAMALEKTFPDLDIDELIEVVVEMRKAAVEYDIEKCQEFHEQQNTIDLQLS